MRVSIDGSVFLTVFQKGIQRYYEELLSRLDIDLETSIYLKGRCCANIPTKVSVITAEEHVPVLERSLVGMARRISRKARRHFYPTPFPTGDLFHPTYYTTAPDSRMPTAITVHDMLFERIPGAFPASIKEQVEQKRQAIFSASHIIAISEATRDDLIAVYPETRERISVVHHGCCHFQRISLNEAFERKARHDSYVLFVGQRKVYKNFIAVLDAMGESEWPSEVGLVAVGEAFNDGELANIRSRSLGNRVRAVVFPDDAVLKELYIGAHAFVFPSMLEGFGFPILEAQCLGVPTVATDCPVFREIGGKGFLAVDSGMPDQIARGISRCGDPVLRRDLVMSGLENCERFRWDDCARKTFQVWRECAGA